MVSPRPTHQALLLSGLLTLSLACRSEGSQESSGDAPAEAVELPADAVSFDDRRRELWRSTCFEVLPEHPEAGQPPPPPPPLLVPSDEDLEAILRDAELPLAKSDEPGTFEPRTVTPQVSSHLSGRLARRLGPKVERCELDGFVAHLEPLKDEEFSRCALAFAHAHCEQPEKARAWVERRVAEFPNSAGARLARVHWLLAPLDPPPTMGYPVNRDIPSAERRAIADAALAELDELLAGELQPSLARAAHTLASSALTYRSLSHDFAEPPATPEDVLAIVLSRKDGMRAWEHVRAIGELDGLELCKF